MTIYTIAHASIQTDTVQVPLELQIYNFAPFYSPWNSDFDDTTFWRVRQSHHSWKSFNKHKCLFSLIYDCNFTNKQTAITLCKFVLWTFSKCHFVPNMIPFWWYMGCLCNNKMLTCLLDTGSLLEFTSGLIDALYFIALYSIWFLHHRQKLHGYAWGGW